MTKKILPLLLSMATLIISQAQTTTNVVTDGTFSQGSSYWVPDSRWVIGCSGNCNGTTYASTVVNDGSCANAYQNLNNDIYQYLTIPANATSASLSFVARGIYQNSSNANNSLNVYLGGTLVYSTTVVNINSSSCVSVGPISVSVANSSTSFPLQLKFNANTGGTNGSGTWSKFYIDNVVLNVTYNNCTTPSAPSVSASSYTMNCSGNPPVLTASGACSGCSYSWSTGATGSQITATQSGTYYVSVTNTCGLTSNGSSVTINPPPSPQTPVISAPSSICSGQPINLSISNPCNGCTYTWSNATSSGGNGTSATATITGSQTIGTTVTDACGNTSVGSITLQASSSNYTVSLTANPATICPTGGSTTLTASITSGTCNSCTYTWSPNTSGGTSSTTTASVSGNYSVTARDGCNNSVTASASTSAIQAPQTPQLSANPSSVCSNQTSIVTIGNAAAYSGCSTCTYAWNSGTGGNTSHTVTGPGTYSVTITNTACTNMSVTNSVTVTPNNNQPVVPTFSPATLSVCTGQSAPLSIANTSQCSGCSYRWVCPSGNCSTTTGTSITVTGPGTITVIDSNSCGSTNTASITIASNPTTSIIASAQGFCNGDSVLLTCTSTASLYSWSNGATSPAIYVKNGNNYTVTAVNPNGCTGSATASKSVSLYSNPTANAGSTQTVTIGQSVLLGGLATGGTSPYQYSWSANANNATTDTTSVLITAPADFCVTVTDNHGCRDSKCVHIDTTSSSCGASLTLDHNSKHFGSTGGHDTIFVTAPSNCSWTAVANPSSLIFIQQGTTGIGNSSIRYFVDVCPGNTDQTGTITVGTKTFAVTQTCQCNLSGAAQVTVAGAVMAAQNIASATYEWFYNGGTTPISTSRVYTATQNGIYTVNICEGPGCCITTDVSITSIGIVDLDISDRVQISPNPTKGNLEITGTNLGGGDMNIAIYNTVGQLVWQKAEKLNASNFKGLYSLSNLSSGVYQIVINTGEGKVLKKIVIER